MDKFLYLAMTGAKATVQAQNYNTHNMANSSTPGFKSDFERFVSSPVEGPVHNEARVYSVAQDTGSDFTPGSMISTGNHLDFAVQGEGFIAVQTPKGEGYTRRGDLQVSGDGILINGAGQQVLGNAGPIALPAHDRLEIGEDGTVSIVPQGGAANNLLVVDRIKLVNPDVGDLAKGTDGIFRHRNGEDIEVDGAVRVASGVLENSNVNMVETMVQMISLARQYEANVKMMTTASEIDEASSRLLRLS